MNLNRARKDRARKAAKRTADANAVAFGRSKADRKADAARKTAEAARLDGHKRDDDGRDG